jgi:hypothetical protein
VLADDKEFSALTACCTKPFRLPFSAFPFIICVPVPDLWFDKIPFNSCGRNRRTLLLDFKREVGAVLTNFVDEGSVDAPGP